MSRRRTTVHPCGNCGYRFATASEMASGCPDCGDDMQCIKHVVTDPRDITIRDLRDRVAGLEAELRKSREEIQTPPGLLSMSDFPKGDTKVWLVVPGHWDGMGFEYGSIIGWLRIDERKRG